ncbi:MAG: RrF2 family transcriptional regulator [Anaerorhabdus sp.]|uniref:RrF2 family transcriptional regulator n=1 Tax=Anaerorhabdus sp. TaxID=1872524 RepID=UPI003A8A95A3
MNSDLVVGIHAMVFLHHKKGTISSESLADNICTNPARVRRVMAKLKKAGIIETREGRTDGGYYCKENRVTLGDIGKALEVNFSDFSWHSGDSEKSCLISSGMAGYMDNLRNEINKKCMDYLESIMIEDVEKKLINK